MNTYLLKEATKLAVMTASIDGQKFEGNDALSELIKLYYEDLKKIKSNYYLLNSDKYNLLCALFKINYMSLFRDPRDELPAKQKI